MVLLLRATWIVALCAIGVARAETVFPLVVTGDRVCLRAKADGESEVVCQVSSGTVLQRTGGLSNWVEVLAPGEASVWLATNLVSNGVVLASKAHVRAGPGMNYPAVGSVQKDDRVEVRGESYGWVKIKPPESCRLWISRSYVKDAPEQKPVAGQPLPRMAPTASESLHRAVSVSPAPPAAVAHRPFDAASSDASSKSAPVPVSAPALSSVAPAPTTSGVASQTVAKTATNAVERGGTRQPPVLPEALKRYEMDPEVSQARQALYRGTMDKCNWLLRKPAEYRLVVKHPHRGLVTLCYVLGDPVLLAALDGKRVAVSGREYRLKGVERPVVVYESVVEEAADVTGAGTSRTTP